MAFVQFAKGIFKMVTGPLGVLEEWAQEPLRKWEFKRQEEAKDRDLQREIKRQTEAQRIQSEIAKDEASHKADLEIRMQTEINRINAETEEWQKDKQLERQTKVLDAIKKYQKELMELNTNTIRAIGEMDIDLRRKAQDLVLEKTKEYKLLQDEAQQEAEQEIDRIVQKYASNERVMSIMLTATEAKLTNIIESCSRFMHELSDDIQKMNENINLLTQRGQSFVYNQLDRISNGNPALLDNNKVEDAEAEAVD
jgi:hypothetical protein